MGACRAWWKICPSESECTGGWGWWLTTVRYQIPQPSFSLPPCFLLKGNYSCQAFSCLMFNKRSADQWWLRAADPLPRARRRKLTCHSLFFLLLVKLLDTWCLVQGKYFIPQCPLLKSSHRAGVQQFITSICSTDFWHNCISAWLQGLKTEIWKAAFCHWFMCLLKPSLCTGLQTTLFSAHVICLMHCVQRPPVLNASQQ